jgi:hypothetical protein
MKCGLIFAILVFAFNAVAESGVGTIKGAVRLTGAAPTVPLLQPARDVEVCGYRPRPAQILTLGTNQTVHNAIVYLDAPASRESGRGDLRAGLLDARNCEFVPRIQIARNGAPKLLIRNSDPLLHVVRIESLSSTNGVQMILTVAAPYAGYEKLHALGNFGRPALLRASNPNGHPWMVAYIAVLPHPWAALTDESGNFSLERVPAGTHKLYVWHEVLGALVREVKVSSGRLTTINFEFAGAR